MSTARVSRESVSFSSLSFLRSLFRASISGFSSGLLFVLLRVDVQSENVSRESVSFSSLSFLRSLFLASISGFSFGRQFRVCLSVSESLCLKRERV